MNSTAVDWLNAIGVIVSSPYQLHVESGWFVEQLILFIFPIRAFIVWQSGWMATSEGKKTIHLGGVCLNVVPFLPIGSRTKKWKYCFCISFWCYLQMKPFTFAILSNWIVSNIVVWERIVFLLGKFLISSLKTY